MATRLARRQFLAGAASGLAGLGAIRPARAGSPNERIVLGVMGLKGRGAGLIRQFAGLEDVSIAYLCDVDDSVVGPALELAQRGKEPPPRVVRDFRRILDDQAVDAFVVATPDHWHALATIHACQANKHVYVEKPVSHNVVEGERMVQAARKHDRKVQAGTQRRSDERLAWMVDFLREGGIGKIHFARTWISSRRENIGFAKDEPVPAGVDYDLWLGPAPSRPFNRNHFHYHWHWFWEYGTGELGNNGIHGLDVVRWALGVDWPTHVVSSGGKHFFDDDQVTPDTQFVAYEFPGLTVVWEHRTWSPHELRGSDFGLEFQGEKGMVASDGSNWRTIGVDTPKLPEKAQAREPAHERNWLDAIRGEATLVADIQQGHLSTALCHLGNISHRVGRRLTWNRDSANFGELDADALLRREYRSPWMLPAV